MTAPTADREMGLLEFLQSKPLHSDHQVWKDYHALILGKMNSADAVAVLQAAFTNDSDYAHSWHCNIAMAVYDATREKTREDLEADWHSYAHEVGNDAASRFMKLAFNVETSA